MKGLHDAGKFAATNTFSRCRRGNRDDLGIYVRSSWEANYARYLNSLVARSAILSWEYEPRRFNFPPAAGRADSYLPDFSVTFPDGRCEWHEVKGWMTVAGADAIARFRECYPDETLTLVDANWFKSMRNTDIPHWEKQDAVARWLGLDDGSPLVRWSYAQERAAVPACRIELRGIADDT